MFPAVGVMLRSLHAVTGGLLQRGLKFQTCMNILSEFFYHVQEFLGPISYMSTITPFLTGYNFLMLFSVLPNACQLLRIGLHIRNTQLFLGLG